MVLQALISSSSGALTAAMIIQTPVECTSGANSISTAGSRRTRRGMNTTDVVSGQVILATHITAPRAKAIKSAINGFLNATSMAMISFSHLGIEQSVVAPLTLSVVDISIDPTDGDTCQSRSESGQALLWQRRFPKPMTTSTHVAVSVCQKRCDESVNCRSVFAGARGAREGECFLSPRSAEDVDTVLPDGLLFYEATTTFLCKIQSTTPLQDAVTAILASEFCRCTKTAQTSGPRTVDMDCSKTAAEFAIPRTPQGTAHQQVKVIKPGDVASLELTERSIPSITELSFAGLSSLRVLILRDCGIAAISKATFTSLASLHDVDLSNNKLKTWGKGTGSAFPVGSVAPKNKIQKLDISGNAITSVTGTVFEELELRALTHLTLSRKGGTAFSYQHVAINAFSQLENLSSSNLVMGGLGTTCSATSDGTSFSCSCAKDLNLGPGRSKDFANYGCIKHAPKPPAPSFVRQETPDTTLFEVSNMTITRVGSLQAVACPTNTSTTASTCQRQTICCFTDGVQGCERAVAPEPAFGTAAGSNASVATLGLTGANLSVCTTGSGTFTFDQTLAQGKEWFVHLATNNEAESWVAGGFSGGFTVTTPDVGVGDAVNTDTDADTLILGVSLGAGLGLGLPLLLGIAFLLKRRRDGLKPIARKTFEAAFEEMRASGLIYEEGSTPTARGTAHTHDHSHRTPMPQEMKRSNVHLIEDQILGEGNFGLVQKAILHGTGTVPFAVAVKTIKFTKEADEDEFIKEALASALFDHPNVIKLVGIVTSGTPHLMVLEYCGSGSLLGLLKSRAESAWPLSFDQRLTVALHVARGLQHLHSKNFVHRDVAARNVLVSEDFTFKISDFGLGREMSLGGDDETEMYYKAQGKNPLPIRWTAPEALDGEKFSQASDIWAWGVVCYEVFTDGGKPYPGLNNTMVLAHVTDGGQLTKPKAAPQDFWKKNVAVCFVKEAGQRPQMHTIIRKLEAANVHSEQYLQGAGERTSYDVFDAHAGGATNKNPYATNAEDHTHAHAMGAVDASGYLLPDTALSSSGGVLVNTSMDADGYTVPVARKDQADDAYEFPVGSTLGSTLRTARAGLKPLSGSDSPRSTSGTDETPRHNLLGQPVSCSRSISENSYVLNMEIPVTPPL